MATADHGEAAHRDTYRKSLNFLITHRWARHRALRVAICVISVASIGRGGHGADPGNGPGRGFEFPVSMPNGSTMEDTAAIQDRIAGIVMDTVPETEADLLLDRRLDLDHVVRVGRERYSFAASTSTSATAPSREVAKQLRRDLADIAGCEITVSDQQHPWACPRTRTSASS